MLRNRSVKYENDEDYGSNGLFLKQSFLEVKESYGDTIKFCSHNKKNESFSKSRNINNPFDRKLTSFSVFPSIQVSKEFSKNIPLSNHPYTQNMRKIINKSISSTFPKFVFQDQLKVNQSILHKESDSLNKNCSNSPKSIKQIYSHLGREEKLNIDFIRERKTNFLKKQREYLVQHTKYKTDRILLPNMNKRNNIDNPLPNDVYKSLNELSNEIEYVKKFILPPAKSNETKFNCIYSKEDLNINNQKDIRKKKIILHQLLPKEDSNMIKKGYAIKIQQKGGDYIYQIVKENEKKEKINTKKYEPINNIKERENLRNVKSISETINPIKMRVSSLEFNDLPNVYSTINKYFKDKKLKADCFTRINEDKLNETIKIKIDNLDNVKKSIQSTLDDAVYKLFNNK